VGGFFADLESRRRACKSDVPRDVAACIEGAGAAAPQTSGSRP
jgi:hypothetical protein